MKKEDLLKIIGEDDLGLLSLKPKHAAAASADERLANSFMEINEFFDMNGREPKIANGIQEHQLAARLDSIRSDDKKRELLKAYDAHHLLDIGTKKEINSISDILKNDDLNLLDDDHEDILTLKNVPKITTMPDYVARRKPCKDFDKFEILFIDCQHDLKFGKRKLLPFTKEQEIDMGYFFVLKGILLYIAEIEKRELKNGKVNARMRCIFENGTESDMLLRSLSAELYKDGKRVTAHEDSHLDNFNNINEDDRKTGFIYVVRSQSKNEKINTIKNLFKIGFSTTPVEERIKNASYDPTYLMAPVSIVTTFECYNVNPHKLEQLLHNFFGASCLNLDIFDKEGTRYSPREWFIAPLEIIEKSIELIINGAIVNFKYDATKQEIVLR